MLLLVYSGLLFGQTANHPFPNHTIYVGNHIKPNNYTQTELDNHVRLFYDGWKLKYLKNDCGNLNEYYVFSGGTSINVSEAQGYGMMLTAYFAGYDFNAQTYFNGLYQFFKSHPSNINSNLMDWRQVTCNDKPSSDDDSASDGDIDMAFALLLADAQWGSNGAINYLAEAKRVINAIMKDEINQSTWTVKLGDWSNANNPNYFYGTRPSDFIIDHFRVFSCSVNNTKWDNVVNACYALIENMQANYSSTTGLIPDFIIDVNKNPKPAGANYLEGNYDGDYYYNSCRVPWRLGLDYLINGEIRAKTALNIINSWLMTATSANINNISNGYKLNGTAIYSWNDATYLAPFAVSAMADVSNQTWLNSLYNRVLKNNDLASKDYYSNTLKLLSMIAISGNYWVPKCGVVSASDIDLNNTDINIFPNNTDGLINIRLNNNQIPNNILLGKIWDINGKVLIDNLTIHDHQQIDISTFKTGIYFISIEINRKVVTKKNNKEITGHNKLDSEWSLRHSDELVLNYTHWSDMHLTPGL